MTNDENAPPQPGQRILVRALKADGHAYRWWRATVLGVYRDRIVTVTHPGELVEGTETEWRWRHVVRTIYWFDRWYNLAEVYEPDGRLRQLYAHIAGPPLVRGDILEYVDYELDVVKRRGEPVRVVDQNEFALATREYDYSPALQQRCWQAVEQAVRLLKTWRVRVPAPRGKRRR